MNEFDLVSGIINDHGLETLLLLIVIFGLYKLARWFLNNYLEVIKENHRLEREGQASKDVQFLKAMGEIVSVIKEETLHFTVSHKEMHKKLDNIHLDVKEIKTNQK